MIEKRERSTAFAITTKTKERLSKEIGDLGFIDDERKKQQFTNFIETKFTYERKSFVDSSNEDDPDIISLKVPEIRSSNKTSKIKFADKSRIVDLGVKSDVINKEKRVVDFKKLINQFDEKNIDLFEIQDLICFDFEAVTKTKDKLNDCIDKTSVLVNLNKNDVEKSKSASDLLSFFNNKLYVSSVLRIIIKF